MKHLLLNHPLAKTKLAIKTQDQAEAVREIFRKIYPESSYFFDVEEVRYIWIDEHMDFEWGESNMEAEFHKKDKFHRITFDDFYLLDIAEREVEDGEVPENIESVDLNGEYTATLFPYHVEVGCQKFSYRSIEKLTRIVRLYLAELKEANESEK